MVDIEHGEANDVEHHVDPRQARIKFSMSVDVEDVQFISCIMCPVDTFLTASDGGNIEQSGKEFIGMGMHAICAI